MARNGQLVRMLSIMRDLQAARGGLPVAALVRKHGISRRTLERDFAAFAEAGIDVETLPGDTPGRVRKKINGRTPDHLPAATASELAAAKVAASFLDREADTVTAGTFGVLLERLVQAQSTSVRVDADALAQSRALISHPRLAGSAKPEVVSVLHDAILRCKRVRLTCRVQRSNTVKAFVAEPYGILAGGRNYLVWRGVEDGKLRKFILPYIKKVEVLEATFVRDPALSLEAYANGSFGVMADEEMNVELSVAPSAAERMKECRLHPSQVIEDHEDGGCTVRFRAAGADEICNFVFGLGPDVSIVGPEKLRDILARRLTEQLGIYGPEAKKDARTRSSKRDARRGRDRRPQG